MPGRATKAWRKESEGGIGRVMLPWRDEDKGEVLLKNYSG